MQSTTHLAHVPVPAHPVLPMLAMYEQPSDRYCITIQTPRGIYYRRKYEGPQQRVFWDATFVPGKTEVLETFLAAYRYRNDLVRVNILVDPLYETARVMQLDHSALYPNA